MEKSPGKVYRSELVEDFTANLNKLESRKAELEKLLLNGPDNVKELCIELRLEVDLVTETALEEIRNHRATILKQINDYEEKTVASIKTKPIDKFQSSIKEMAGFSQEWKNYLTKLTIDEKVVAARNESALKLIQKAERERKKIISFIFNKKTIFFVKNKQEVEIRNLGVLKYKSVGCYDLKDLKQIDIKDIVRRGKNLQVYPQDDDTFDLVLSFSFKGLWFSQVRVDSNNISISPSSLFSTRGYLSQFRKQKDTVYIYYIDKKYDCKIIKLNFDNSVFRCIRIKKLSTFLSANDSHVYSFHDNQLSIYNRELELLKQVGQRSDPKSAFFLPDDIKQFESHKGKYFWLDNSKLQILREDNGELVNSVLVCANSFLIDSNDDVVLINSATKEINRFNENGILLDQIPIYNYTIGLKLALRKDGGLIFFTNTFLFI